MARQRTRLANLIERVSAQVDTAQCHEDIAAAVREIEGFDGPLVYDNRPVVLSIVVTAYCLTLFALGLWSYTYIGKMWWLPVLLASPWLAFLMYWLYRVFGRPISIHDLLDRIVHRDALMDNNLRPLAIDGAREARRLAERLYEFNRGNHYREIRNLVEGRHTGEQHEFSYYVYHLYYESQVSDRDNGKSTSYSHRYGLLVPFDYDADVAVVSDRPPSLRASNSAFELDRGSGSISISGTFSFGGSAEHEDPSSAKMRQWQPASNRFNRLYRVYAESDMVAAKLLQPAVVEILEAAAEVFKNPNFEFSRSGDFCMSFDDDDLLTPPRIFDFENPALFMRDLARKRNLLKLQHALDLIHQLMKYVDNKFKENAHA